MRGDLTGGAGIGALGTEAPATDAERAWTCYVWGVWEMTDAAEWLGSAPESVLRASAAERYWLLPYYLEAWAPPRVRAMFVDELLDQAFAGTCRGPSSIAAVGTVDAAVVRRHLPAFARRMLRAEPGVRFPAALHLLWLYGEYTAVRAITGVWRRKHADSPSQLWPERAFDTFEAQHPMPVVSDTQVCGWLTGALAGIPGQRGPWEAPDSVPDPGAVAGAGELWGAFGEGAEAAAAVGRAGPRDVLRHALSVPGPAPADCVARLLGEWFRGREEMMAAAELIGPAFFGVYYPLLLRLATSSAADAVGLLPVLRRTALAHGRADLAREATSVERTVYGTFDEEGILSGIRG
ncbi:MAG TPA: hypothetical protein VGG75_25785 [Trebonia sp.]|jgi:hypothetical protein